jgi:hypothetical protein
MRWILPITLLLACGGPAKPPSFDDLSEDKKSELMATKVVPQIGGLLKGHDPVKFEKISCATCHGSGSKLEDPPKVLPKLTAELRSKEPAMTKLMTEKIAPAMGEILGEKDFGCKGCHHVE